MDYGGRGLVELLPAEAGVPAAERHANRFVTGTEQQTQFELVMMPHLDAAYNLARWLAGNDHDAKDIAQEAFLRALRFFDGYHGGNSRSWLLTIVRNTAFSWLKKNRPAAIVSIPDETLEKVEARCAGEHANKSTPHRRTLPRLE